MSPSGSSGSEGGVILNPPHVNDKKRPNPAKGWCFTWFDFPENWKTVVPGFRKNKNIKGYVAGREICPTTGKPHIQGYCESNTKIRPMGLGPKEIHWIAAKGNMSQNYTYCSKDGDWIQWGSCKQKINMEITEEDILPYDEMFDWGRQLEDRVTDCLPDKRDRTIYWYWSQAGQMKKTETARRLVFHHDALVIQGGRKHILANAYKVSAPIYILIIPRTDEGFVSYASIELLKDALYMSAFGVEATGSVNRKKPWVICIANFPPIESALSEDRWYIENVDIVQDPSGIPSGGPAGGFFDKPAAA